MTKERKFKKEYAIQLMRIAEGDLSSANGLHQVKAGRPENVLFLAHQAIEKSLKAVLCWKGIPVPLIHEMRSLIDRFPTSIVVPDADQMLDLDPFASIRRYEEGFAEISPTEIELVLDLARRTVTWAKQAVA